MQLGRIIGQAISTIKHPSMQGWRLLIVQPINSAEKFDGEPVLAVDSLGAGTGDKVMISSDGAGVRKLLDSKTTPVRWFVLGIMDT